jgi:hypothetical protein
MEWHLHLIVRISTAAHSLRAISVLATTTIFFSGTFFLGQQSSGAFSNSCRTALL